MTEATLGMGAPFGSVNTTAKPISITILSY